MNENEDLLNVCRLAQMQEKLCNSTFPKSEKKAVNNAIVRKQNDLCRKLRLDLPADKVKKVNDDWNKYVEENETSVGEECGEYLYEGGRYNEQA